LAYSLRTLTFLSLCLACGPSPAATGSATETGTGDASTTGAAGTSTGAPGDSTGVDETTVDPTTTGPGTSTGEPASTGTTGDASTGDGTTGEPVDCAALPKGPLPYTKRPGPAASEDLAFDHEGNLIGAQNGSLFKSPFEGAPQLWIPGAGGFIAGLRATADGTIVYADNDTMTLFRVSPGNNFKEMVLGGLEYANGLEVDLDGFVYVAEQSGQRVRRVDPKTGQFEILADGLNQPNGVSFSPDYRTLYVGSFGGGSITSINFNEDKSVAGVEIFQDFVGGGALDGMAVDACGNVYVCDFGAATIWRISPDGLTSEPLVNLSADTGWIPNMQWGSGIGGWDKETLYVLDFGGTNLFEIELGVGDKPRAYP
jgi:streptogramin lyase